MGLYYTIDVDARLVNYVMDGYTTSDHARAFFAGILAHPDYEPGFNFLGDHREVAEEPDSVYIRAVSLDVMMRKAVLGPCRWAVVVSSDVGFGMARMWSLLTESSGVQIVPFRTSSAAAKWVGLPASYSPSVLALAY